MTNTLPELVITGVGVTASIGQGKAAFISGLLQGHSHFDVMQRPGRQSPVTEGDKEGGASHFLGAEITALQLPETIPATLRRTTSLSAQVALTTLHEAWHDAKLLDVDPLRIGLIIGGSNFQQRELTQIQQSYRDRSQFLRPTYALSFMDTDVCGLCSELYGIQGFAYTIGGASASGQVAVIQAINAVQSGQVDVCIAIGALMDLSYWECQGFRSLGAMGSDRYAKQPQLACRPFDTERDGFIYGESCGAVVIESTRSSLRRGVSPYARLTGWAMKMDGNRNPNPSFEGEASVLQNVMHQSQLRPNDIDYLNPHGTGSTIGDETELKAIRHCDLSHAYLNATKSITGHGLSAAGTVELIAILLQMKAGQLHPTRNLESPIDASFNWVRSEAIAHQINNAINLSMGFGGSNTAICLQRV